MLTLATFSSLTEEPPLHVNEGASELTGTASLHLSIDLRNKWINRGATLFLKPIP